MRKLSEIRQADKDDKKRRKEARIKRVNQCIATMPDTKDKKLLWIRQKIGMQFEPLNVSCDKCGSELVRETTYLTGQKLTPIYCGGCGFSDNIDMKIVRKYLGDL